VAALLSGCANFWERLRETERGHARDHARELASQGRCPEALRSLERSQANSELGGTLPHAHRNDLASRTATHVGDDRKEYGQRDHGLERFLMSSTT